jgi:GT2 family glycosyltransferase
MSHVLLSISIVTYRQDFALFAQALKHLHAALQHLARQRPEPVHISIVDNGDEAAKLRDLLQRSALADITEITNAGRNLGYGKAHNLAISSTNAAYHLVMNPDVFIAEDALTLAVTFLEEHPDVSALSPYAVDGAGRPAFLCKRYPTLLDLALRGFAPGVLRHKFSARLDQYENRELVARQQPAEVDLISGCFMFCRTEALRRAGGFNPVFFLYFEDFSLSLELQKFGRLMYVPACRIAHYGGNAGKKGLRHLMHFAASALKFYNQYGWKLL